MYADLLGDIQEGVRGPGGLLYTVASWHILIKGLKWMENHLPLDLEGGDQVHSDLLDQIIAVGITIQQQANGEKVALSKEDHGTTMEEVQASLDWLRDKRSMWHGDVTAKRRAAVLESLFGHATA
jgi:hypothetical protein